MSDHPENISNDISLTKNEVDFFLKKYFSYYASLTEDWKKVFCQRVISFAQTKKFMGHNGFVANNQVRAIISASAVQLTLGLETWDLHYFNTILVFPDDFFNRQSGLKLKGETNLAGFISLSWKSFLKGYEIRHDNLNLGIHEFTHALRFNGIRSENTDYFFSHYFAKWYCIGYKEFHGLTQNRPSIFRAYGGANANEFLSVAIEHFFESPEEFKTALPLLYSSTAILLNQKTEGPATELNVRRYELDAQKPICVLPEINSPVSFFKSTSAYIGLILLGLGIFTFFAAGLFSFPTLFLFSTGLLNLIVSDFKHASGIIYSEKIAISKGFLLFKGRKNFSIPFPHLVRADFFSESSKDEAVMLTFFHSDDYFYEETFHLELSKGQKESLFTALRKNFVWVNTSA